MFAAAALNREKPEAEAEEDIKWEAEDNDFDDSEPEKKSDDPEQQRRSEEEQKRLEEELDPEANIFI